MRKSIELLLIFGLGASVAWNAVLAYCYFQRSDEGLAFVSPVSQGVRKELIPRSDSGREESSDARPELEVPRPLRDDLVGVSFLTAGKTELLQVAAALSEAGFDERQVGFMLHGAVQGEWNEMRVRLLLEKQGGVAWKPAAVLDPSEFSALLAMRREAEAVVAATVEGGAPLAADAPFFASRLDPERAQMLARTEEEYRLLRQYTEQQMGAVRLEEDIEALHFLDAERRRDLAAFLTPDEVADFLLSEDHMGKRLRREFRYFEPSPDELRELFRVQDLSREIAGEYFWSKDLMKRDDLTGSRQEALREILSPERFQQLMEMTEVYSKVRGVADRHGFSREVAEAVVGFVERAEAELVLIEGNQSLPRANRRELAAELHKRNRQAVLDQVGPEGAAIYQSAERRVQ